MHKEKASEAVPEIRCMERHEMEDCKTVTGTNSDCFFFKESLMVTKGRQRNYRLIYFLSSGANLNCSVKR